MVRGSAISSSTERISESLLFRSGPTCFFIPLAIDTCGGLTSIAAPLVLKSHYGLRDSEIGWVLGTGTILYVLTCFFGGRLADRVGYETMIKTGLAIVALNAVSFLLWGPLPYYIVCTIFSPLGHAFFWPAFQAWIGRDVDRLEMARRIGIFSVGWSLGLSAVGPLVAGWTLEFDRNLPFTIAMLLSVGTLAVFQFARPELPRHEVHATGHADDFVPQARRRAFLSAARVGIVSAVVAMAVVRTYFPLIGLDWKLSTSSIGAIVTVLGLGQSGIFLVLTLTHRWHYRSSYLLSAQVLGAAGLLLFSVLGIFLVGSGDAADATVGVALAIPALFCAGIMSGVCYFSSAFYALFGEETKGKNSGIHESLIGVGYGIAQYGGGAAVRYIHKLSPYFLCGLLIFGFILWQWKLIRVKENPKK